MGKICAMKTPESRHNSVQPLEEPICFVQENKGVLQTDTGGRNEAKGQCKPRGNVYKLNKTGLQIGTCCII